MMTQEKETTGRGSGVSRHIIYHICYRHECKRTTRKAKLEILRFLYHSQSFSLLILYRLFSVSLSLSIYTTIYIEREKPDCRYLSSKVQEGQMKLNYPAPQRKSRRRKSSDVEIMFGVQSLVAGPLGIDRNWY